MRKLAITATAAVFTLTASAQDALQCVNPDFLNGLFFQGRSEMKVDVTRSLPPVMSSFSAPTDFRLIGTGVRGDGSSTIVAYKTSLPGDKAYAAILASLATEGWAVEVDPMAGATFVVEGGGPRNGTVCRKAERRRVSVDEASGSRYVTITFYQQSSPLRDCNAPDPNRYDPAAQQAAFTMMRNLLPRFRFPQGTSIVNGQSGGTSNGNWTRIVSTETVATLVASLGNELTGQGWRPDAEWSGSGSSGSTWRKTSPNDGKMIFGTFEITGTGQGSYDVDFTLLSPPQ